MADKVIQQIQATDGTIYEIDAKYFSGRTFEEVFAQADAMIYKGVLTFTSETGNNLYTPAADKGYVYKVAISSGITDPCYVNNILVESGDMLICNTDNTPAASSTSPQTSKWDAIQSNIDASGLATSDHIHSYTPEGTVSQPTFAGSQVDSASGKANITSTVTDNKHSHGIGHTSTSSSTNTAKESVASSAHTHKVTADGTVDVTLTDNGHTHSVTAEGTVQLTRSQNVVASSSNTGAHTHTISIDDASIDITDTKHTHSATVTNYGTAAAQVFTGTEASTKATEANAVSAAAQAHTHGISGSGTAAAQVFTGSDGTTNQTDAKSTVEVSTKSHTHTFTPSGSVTGTFTGKEGTTTNISGTVNVAADGHTHGGGLRARVENNVLIFSIDGTVSASTSKTAVATSAHTHTYKPSGDLSLQFSSTQTTIGATDTTNVASVASSTHTHGFKPSGTNAASNVTVSGTASATTTAAVSVAAQSHTHKFTAVGTNDASAVSGTTVSIGSSSSGISGSLTLSSLTTSSNGGHAHNINITSQPAFIATFTGSAVDTESANTGITADAEFTGLEVTSGSPSATVNVAALSHSHTYDKATSIVSAATGITISSVDNGHIHKVIASGTVSQPTFTGKPAQTNSPENPS